jgi:hypothetical protein
MPQLDRVVPPEVGLALAEALPFATETATNVPEHENYEHLRTTGKGAAV